MPLPAPDSKSLSGRRKDPAMSLSTVSLEQWNARLRCHLVPASSGRSRYMAASGFLISPEMLDLVSKQRPKQLNARRYSFPTVWHQSSSQQRLTMSSLAWMNTQLRTATWRRIIRLARSSFLCQQKMDKVELMVTEISTLSEREILALAISLEEEDA